MADFSAVTAYDIEQGRNVLETPYGPAAITSPCGYAVLEPQGDTRGIATIEGQTVAVQTADGRFMWFGLTLSAGFGDVGQPDLVRGLTREAGVAPPWRWRATGWRLSYGGQGRVGCWCLHSTWSVERRGAVAAAWADCWGAGPAGRERS